MLQKNWIKMPSFLSTWTKKKIINHWCNLAVATMKKAGPSEKVEAEATFIEKALKPMLAKIEKWITDNGTGFLVGHQVHFSSNTALNNRLIT